MLPSVDIVGERDGEAQPAISVSPVVTTAINTAVRMPMPSTKEN
jgi:hypothetical protein